MRLAKLLALTILTILAPFLLVGPNGGVDWGLVRIVLAMLILPVLWQKYHCQIVCHFIAAFIAVIIYIEFQEWNDPDGLGLFAVTLVPVVAFLSNPFIPFLPMLSHRAASEQWIPWTVYLVVFCASWPIVKRLSIALEEQRALAAKVVPLSHVHWPDIRKKPSVPRLH